MDQRAFIADVGAHLAELIQGDQVRSHPDDVAPFSVVGRAELT